MATSRDPGPDEGQAAQFPPTEAAPRQPSHPQTPLTPLTLSPAHPPPGHQLPLVTPLPPSRPPSTGSGVRGRFALGAVLGGRYRILELIGHGGMGEVYRAEDLLLDQRVALKFLPAAFDDDAERMERLLAEVRLARGVSHPNVCRVYDVGEADGHRFFSMELVEGDDLQTLLRQVGRIPAEKGLEIARQLCAGLAAAHDRGVIHRDLKPSNVLVDRSGKVHIADFGLALAEAASGADAMSGSLGYMAPEQLAGREATVRSDIFVLGIVLYELFTGRRAFRAHTLKELRHRVNDEPLTRPSEVVAELDPAIERVILRCLAHDPADRPGSALAVAAALPGGDPLAAALAAGETPSPEMVAAAGGEGGLPAWKAALLAGGAGLLMVLGAVAVSQSHVAHFLPLDKPPDFLDERAREILASLGHRAPARVKVAHWEFDRAPLDFLAERSRGSDRWRPLDGGRLPVQWRLYRQSPRDFRSQPGFSVVKSYDPRPAIPGEAQVQVDTRGRLLGLAIVPPEHDATPAVVGEPRWETLFAAAGLDVAAFHPVRPEWTPPVAGDRRAAWVGEAADAPGIPLRLEAAAYHGRPVWWRLVGPWTPTGDAHAQARVPGELLGSTANAVLWFVLCLGGLLARRNIRRGRGDRRGASRLAFWFFTAHTLVWMGQADHAHTLAGEWYIVQRDWGYNLFLTAVLWVGYVAVEPYVRRHWPETLISWSRLLAGSRLRDPRVGRDVLIGSVVGATAVLLDWLAGALPAWRAGPPPLRLPLADDFLLDILDQVIHPLLYSLLFLVVLVGSLVVVRKRSLTVPFVVLVFSLLFWLQGGRSTDWLAFIPTVLFATLIIGGLARYGLLALTVAPLVYRVLVGTPWTLDTQAWYTWQSVVAGLVLVAVLAFGYRTAATGRMVLAARPVEA